MTETMKRYQDVLYDNGSEIPHAVGRNAARYDRSDRLVKLKRVRNGSIVSTKALEVYTADPKALFVCDEDRYACAVPMLKLDSITAAVADLDSWVIDYVNTSDALPDDTQSVTEAIESLSAPDGGVGDD